MSGNISMLKRVCEAMMRQNNLNSNSTEAVRVLLAIEIIFSDQYGATEHTFLALASRSAFVPFFGGLASFGGISKLY